MSQLQSKASPRSVLLCRTPDCTKPGNAGCVNKYCRPCCLSMTPANQLCSVTRHRRNTALPQPPPSFNSSPIRQPAIPADDFDIYAPPSPSFVPRSSSLAGPSSSPARPSSPIPSSSSQGPYGRNLSPLWQKSMSGRGFPIQERQISDNPLTPPATPSRSAARNRTVDYRQQVQHVLQVCAWHEVPSIHFISMQYLSHH